MLARTLLLAAALAAASLLVAPAAPAAPTPGLACQLAAATAAVRIVPEPEATNDYISYADARECLAAIEAVAPDFFEMKTLGPSVGWSIATGATEQYDVWLVEVTNEQSAVPFEHRLKHIFQLSIHGNEKGGREGGLRVIEDLARCLEVPGAITAEYPELCDYLDYMVAVFTFPNPDGWAHDELPVLAAEPGTGYTRGNGNGVDLNRQWPNKGWNNQGHRALSQPEIQASLAALTNYTNVATATDIHGMLNPTDADPAGELARLPQDREYAPGGSLLEGLLDAGQADALKMFKTTRLAELLKERVNADASLIEWSAVPATGAWGGHVMEWGTSWDTIGYVDSGFTGDFFFQNHGLNATAMDFEMAYNHIVCDSQYVGCGHEMNRLHVRLVRQVVAVFMESAAQDVRLSIETNGVRAAYLHNPLVVASVDAAGTPDELTGWAMENPADDAYDYAHTPYTVYGDQYLRDLKPFLRDGERPGVLERLTPAAIRQGALAGFDAFVVAGSAYATIQDEPDTLAAIKAWVEDGGDLVLTDSALAFLEDAKFLSGTGIVNVRTGYAGYADFERRDHPLAAGLRGLARQTYEAVPLGYQPGQAPIWTVQRAAIMQAGGVVVGSAGGGSSAGLPVVAPSSGNAGEPTYGQLDVGSGSIRFLGALLPDPTEEFYHPYGLDAYATTYTGNELFQNMLGWTTVHTAPPVVIEDLGKDRTPMANVENSVPEGASGASPGPVLAFILLAVASAAFVRRR